MLVIYITHLLFSENEEPDADVPEEDNEIFFGPVGHTEKCVAVGVNEASHSLQPLSPLSAVQMAELCREAYTVAYQIEHADSMKLPRSHYKATKICRSDTVSRSINPVKDLMSDVDVACQSEHTGTSSTKLLNVHAETNDVASGHEVQCDNPVTDSILNAAVAHQSEHASSVMPLASCAETTEATSNNKIPCDNPVNDFILSIAVECQSEHATSAKLTLDAETTEVTSSDEIPSDNLVMDLISNIKLDYCDSLQPLTKNAEMAGTSCDIELSDNIQVEELSLNVAEADMGQCLDETLSSNLFNDPTFDSNEYRKESLDNKPSSSNVFDGLLLSLGSALPVVEPGSLNQDEQGVVKFTAAAADVDTKTKCRSGIPPPSSFRRSSSAKSAGIRSTGIPMKALTVSHLCHYLHLLIRCLLHKEIIKMFFFVVVLHQRLKTY